MTTAGSSEKPVRRERTVLCLDCGAEMANREASWRHASERGCRNFREEIRVFAAGGALLDEVVEVYQL